MSASAWEAPILPPSVTVPVPLMVRVLSKPAASSALTAPAMVKLLAPVEIVMPLAPSTVEPVQVEGPPTPLILMVGALMFRVVPVKFNAESACVAPTF